MNIIILNYAVCAGIGLTLTTGITAILCRQARAVLVTAHRGDPALAGPLIYLFGVGYFLLNACNIVFTLGAGQAPLTAQDTVNYLCVKIGWIMYLQTLTFFGAVILVLVGNRVWNERKIAPIHN